jgi:hypothetical protein
MPETYHWEINSLLKRSDPTIKVHEPFVRNITGFDLNFNDKPKYDMRIIALINFLPHILHGLHKNLLVECNKTFFFPKVIRRFFGMFFPETCLDFRQFAAQTHEGCYS